MDHFKNIYSHHAFEYQRMIAAEDADKNILSTLLEITSFAGKKVFDLGTGTGRIPLLLANQNCQVTGLDLHAAMLQQQQVEKKQLGGSWHLVQGDMRFLPYAERCADITLAGWAIGHMCSWFAEAWKSAIGQTLREMQRITKPGGYILILETLGTGSLTPAPPTAELAQYYTWLEDDWIFAPIAIQTDYLFSSVDQAVEYTEFFFGPSLAAAIREYAWSRLPEWTGLWVKRV